MAYVPQQLPDEEKNQLGRTAPTTPYPIAQGGGSAGSGAAAPGVGTPTQFGSNAAKLSDYLKANKEQVGEFGNQIAGKLNQDYTKTMGDIDTGYGGFNQQVQGSYTPGNDQLVNQAKSNPSEFVKNPDDVSKFQSLYNDQYTGPQNFESSDVYGNLNNEVNSAVQNAGLTNSFSGLGTYLNNTMGGANRTQGMNTLDTALLQRSPEASSAIKSAAAPYQNLNSYLGDKTSSADKNVATAQTQADQIRGAVQNEFTGPQGVIPTFQNQLSQNLSGAQNNYQNVLSDYSHLYSGAQPSDLQMKNLFSPDLTKMNAIQENAKMLGSPVTPNYGQFVTLNNPSGAPTMGSVATPDQIDTAKALSILSGNPDLQIQGAGSPYQAPTLGYNSQGFNSYMNDLSNTNSDQKAFATIPQGNVQAIKSLTPDQITSYLNGSPNFNPGLLSQMFPGDSFKQTVDVMMRLGMLPAGTLTGGVTPSTGPGVLGFSGTNGVY